MDFLLVAGGAALLYLGGTRLIDDASEIARRLGMSPLVVGLTVVAFATSAPELAATFAAALAGSHEIAVGNVVGSNISNIGLILGVTAILRPLRSSARFLRRELPFMLGASVVVAVLLLDGVLGRLAGAALLAGLAFYLWFLLRETPEETARVEREFAEVYPEARRPWASWLGVLLAVALLVIGARALVAGGTGLARTLGVSERVIGLTVVAVGTSLPELASSIVAALRRAPDIVLGNLVGSNVFNLLLILGFTSTVRPLTVDARSMLPDLAVMVAFVVVAWPFLWSRLKLGRTEGGVLVLAYAAYVYALFA